MALIDIPLTTGMRQDTAQNIGGDGLWQAINVWMPQPGKLQVRGGFQGAAGDVVASYPTNAGPNGAIRALAETQYGLAVLGDNFVERYDQDPSRDGWIGKAIPEKQGTYGAGACLYSHEVVAAWSSSSTAWYYSRGTVCRVAASASAPVTTVCASNGTVLVRNDPGAGSYAQDWLTVRKSYDGATCVVAGNTSGTPNVYWVTWDEAIATSRGAIGTVPYSSPLVSGIQGYCAGAETYTIGASGGAIVVFVDATNIKVYYCNNTSGPVLKVTRAHGVASPGSARIAVDPVTKRLYVAIGSYVSVYTVYGFRFDVPTDPTGAWTAAPSATFNRTYTGELLDHDIDRDGSGFLCVKSTSSGATTPYVVEVYRYSAELTTEYNVPKTSDITGAIHRPQCSLRSKLFSVPGHDGNFAFTSTRTPIGEPSNALLIMNFPSVGAYALGKGVCSVSYPQQDTAAYYGLLGRPSTGIFTPAGWTYPGDVVHYHSVITSSLTSNGASVPQMVLSTYHFSPQVNSSTGAATANPLSQRSIATDGNHVVVSGRPLEYVGRSGVPGYSVCYISNLGHTAVGSTLVAGTYQVKVLLEVDTPAGKWQGPPSLPVSVTISAGDSIDVGIIASPSGWNDTMLTWRVLVYVAPPGSSIYYLQTYQDSVPSETPACQTIGATISVGAAGTGLTTSSQIIYDTSEPPRTYPGDAYGVAFAGNRFWRFRENSAWFTHSAQGNTIRQWAGDVFRVDFAGRVQGIGQSLGQPVVITDGAVYQLSGPGPDRNGNGSFEVRQINADPLGCLDQRSICNVIPGLCWASNRGIELLPNGSSDIQLISEPVREYIWGSLEAPHQFRLGAHNQPRSTVMWSNQAGVSLVWDYLHGAWFSWVTNAQTANGSIGGSFCIACFNAAALPPSAKLQWDAKGPGAWSYYPMYSTDTLQDGTTATISAAVQTKPLRLSGINKAGSWRGVWILGGTGVASTTNMIHIMQTADGEDQDGVTVAPTGSFADTYNWRVMHLFPVNACDSSSVMVTMDQTADGGDPYLGGKPMFLSALTVEYDATGAPSLLGSSVRS